jgi:hypothetical protein
MVQMIRWRLTTFMMIPHLGIAPGCSEYKLESEAATSAADSAAPDRSTPPDSGDILLPDILVDPSSISIAGLCAETSREVHISNTGSAPLTITNLSLTDPSWNLGEPTPPFAIAPSATKVLHLSGTPGDSELIIESDDPDEPMVRVPLLAAGDIPPDIRITSPSDGAVLAQGEDTALTATVTDAEDPLNSLTLQWTSSLDGLLSTEPAASDGVATVAWPASDRAVANHTITLQATDSCGQTATDAVSICQQDQNTYDEIDLLDWHFEGAARWDEDNAWLELTTPDPYLVGSAFETSVLIDGSEVSIDFLFYIGDGTGADGFSITALDADRYGGVFLGGTGCGLGFGGNMEICTPGPALPGWSLELDTYYNDETSGIDPTTADHLAFYFDGNLSSIEAWAELPSMEDTGWHAMSIEVSAPHVRVSIDEVPYIDTDLDGFAPFNAWVGFTAGTGGQTNRHLIDSLRVTELACDE